MKKYDFCTFCCLTPTRVWVPGATANPWSLIWGTSPWSCSTIYNTTREWIQEPQQIPDPSSEVPVPGHAVGSTIQLESEYWNHNKSLILHQGHLSLVMEQNLQYNYKFLKTQKESLSGCEQSLQKNVIIIKLVSIGVNAWRFCCIGGIFTNINAWILQYSSMQKLENESWINNKSLTFIWGTSPWSCSRTYNITREWILG